MTKKRIFEYANELGMSNKELIVKLEKFGIVVENHLSTIPLNEINPLKPFLYNHKDGTLIIEDFAERIGQNPDYIIECLRILKNEPDGNYHNIDEEAIRILTKNKEPVTVKDLAEKLMTSSQKIITFLRRIGISKIHPRSKIEPLVGNVLEHIEIEGLTSYLKNRKKLGLEIKTKEIKNRNPYFRIGRYILVFILITFLAAFSYVAYGFYGLSKMSQPEKITKNNKISYTTKKLKPNQPINVLLLGVEATNWEDDARSDTIMVVRVEPETNDVTILSLPRDSRVKVENYGLQKLTHAHFYGGAPLMIQTIDENFGIPIDRVVEVNFESFYEIVEYLGGVDINVEKRIRSPKFWKFEAFTIDEGMQHLDGKEALAYVHFRFDQKGDIGRIERQQQFIKVVTGQVKQTKNIIDLPRMINRLAQYIQTDMSVSEMLTWARLLWDVNIDEIKTEMLPGSPDMIYDSWAKKKLSYWIVDQEKADLLVEDIFKVNLSESDDSVYLGNNDESGGSLQTNNIPEKYLEDSKTYTIQAGDTLSSISQKFDLGVNDILKVNPGISNPSKIQPGQVITIPKSENLD